MDEEAQALLKMNRPICIFPLCSTGQTRGIDGRMLRLVIIMIVGR